MIGITLEELLKCIHDEPLCPGSMDDDMKDKIRAWVKGDEWGKIEKLPRIAVMASKFGITYRVMNQLNGKHMQFDITDPETNNVIVRNANVKHNYLNLYLYYGIDDCQMISELKVGESKVYDFCLHNQNNKDTQYKVTRTN